VVDAMKFQEPQGPEFTVRRTDGKDAPGEEFADARMTYCVLDPVYDPAARPAMALYAALCRRIPGREHLAETLEHNLGVLAEEVSGILESLEHPNGRTLRAVATWAYPVDPADYPGVKRLAEMASLDQDHLGKGLLAIEDLSSAADSDLIDIRILPNG
jgi:hypothetical protein